MAEREGWRRFWPGLLVGVSAGCLVLELRPEPVPAAALVPDPAWTLELDPARASPRELRALPGIGVERANAYAEERWTRAGAPFAWSDVPGIGPITEARVLEWLYSTKPGEGGTE